MHKSIYNPLNFQVVKTIFKHLQSLRKTHAGVLFQPADLQGDTFVGGQGQQSVVVHDAVHGFDPIGVQIASKARRRPG